MNLNKAIWEAILLLKNYIYSKLKLYHKMPFKSNRPTNNLW